MTDISTNKPLCPGAQAIPPSDRMLEYGNNYYTCSGCGEKVDNSGTPQGQEIAQAALDASMKVQRDMREPTNLRSILMNLTFITSMAAQKVELKEITAEQSVERVHREIDEAIAAIHALLPEKLVNTETEENSDWFYGYGYNAAIDTIQRNFNGQTDTERTDI